MLKLAAVKSVISFAETLIRIYLHELGLGN